MIMHKYFFIENKLVFFDVDIADHLGISGSEVAIIYESNKNRFLKDTVFKLTRSHIITAETFQGRKFDIKPKFAFSKSAVFVLSMLVHTPEAISASVPLIKDIESKEEQDILRSFSAFSNSLATGLNDDKDTTRSIKAFLKLLIIETLSDIKEEKGKLI